MDGGLVANRQAGQTPRRTLVLYTNAHTHTQTPFTHYIRRHMFICALTSHTHICAFVGGRSLCCCCWCGVTRDRRALVRQTPAQVRTTVIKCRQLCLFSGVWWWLSEIGTYCVPASTNMRVCVCPSVGRRSSTPPRWWILNRFCGETYRPACVLTHSGQIW